MGHSTPTASTALPWGPAPSTPCSGPGRRWGVCRLTLTPAFAPPFWKRCLSNPCMLGHLLGCRWKWGGAGRPWLSKLGSGLLGAHHLRVTAAPVTPLGGQMPLPAAPGVKLDGPMGAQVQAAQSKPWLACAMVFCMCVVVVGSCCWAGDSPRLPYWLDGRGGGPKCSLQTSETQVLRVFTAHQPITWSCSHSTLTRWSG